MIKQAYLMGQKAALHAQSLEKRAFIEGAQQKVQALAAQMKPHLAEVSNQIRQIGGHPAVRDAATLNVVGNVIGGGLGAVGGGIYGDITRRKEDNRLRAILEGVGKGSVVGGLGGGAVMGAAGALANL